MTNLLENSVIFRYLKKICNKIADKWNESQTGWFVTRNLQDIKSNNSIFYKFLNLLINKTFSINIGGRVGEKIKTSVFLNLFSHYEIGVYAMIFLAPIVPTMVCVAIVLLTFISFFINSLVKNNFNIKIDAFGMIAILLICLFFICSVSSYAQIGSLKVFALYLVFISFMFIVIACGSDKKRLKYMICLFVTSGLLVSLYGIYQNFFGNNIGHAWLDEEMFSDISVRVYSTLGNPNVLGEYLLMLIPVCGAMVYASQKWFARIYYFGAMCCGGLCLIFTQSRGCWVGIILVAIVFALLIDKRLVLLGVIGALFLPMFLPESMINRFLSIGNMGDSSTSYRVHIWLGTLRMLKDYWWTGVGVGESAFNTIYPFYAYNATIAHHSHNLYLQIIVETGIGGLLTFLTAMVVSLKKILVGYIVGNKNMYGILCGAIIAGLLGCLLQGMFDYLWYNYRVFAIFWMVIGLGIASRRCACEEDFTHNK